MSAEVAAAYAKVAGESVPPEADDAGARLSDPATAEDRPTRREISVASAPPPGPADAAPVAATAVEASKPEAKAKAIEATPADEAPVSTAPQAAPVRPEREIGLVDTADAAPRVEVAAGENAPRAPGKQSKKDKPNKAAAAAPAPAKPVENLALSQSAANRAKLQSTDLLESGVSAEFFRNEEDSVPPFVDHHDDAFEMVHAPTLSPAAIARRARLRRLVAGVVTFAAVLSLGVLGKQLLGRGRMASAAAKQEIVAVVPPKVEEIAKPVEPAKAEEPKPVEPAKVEEVAKPVEPAKAEEPKPAEADKPAEVAKAAEADKPAEAKVADPATAAELKKKAESLLNRGNRKEAIVVSQAAIEADPTDATPYLLLGSALQDSGKWKDGVESYCECVRHATRGPINECRAMGGHK